MATARPRSLASAPSPKSPKPRQQIAALPTAPIPTFSKTLIGVLASHDDPKPNSRLASVFTHIFNSPRRELLHGYHFAFTGGTHDRLFYGDQKLGVGALPPEVAGWLRSMCGVTRLPATHEGGVIVLSYLISQRDCNIVWPFYAPNANHWQRHENLAFMRLCDHWHVKRLMNAGSVMAWFEYESALDTRRNLLPCPPQLRLERSAGVMITLPIKQPPAREPWFQDEGPRNLNGHTKHFIEMTVALIAHDEMKTRMIEFVTDHERELNKFGTILATGTTGREVAAATSREIDKKMVRHHSGPKGGDIEIATAILYGFCDVVIFFVDPLKPHPHIEDIRVVFQACMVSDQVVMITNEMHAREFMSRVVRGSSSLALYYPDKPAGDP